MEWNIHQHSWWLVQAFKGITSTIWEDEMLALRRGGIYEVCHLDGLRLNDIHTKFHGDWFRHSSSIKTITSTIWEAAVLVLLIAGVYDVSLKITSRGMVSIPSFMKIGTGFQAIWRVFLKYFGICNVGIIDGNDLWIALEMGSCSMI
jgi:hypothetical protein